MPNIAKVDQQTFEVRSKINDAFPDVISKDADFLRKRVAERLTLRLEILDMKPKDLAWRLMDEGIIKTNAKNDCTIRHIKQGIRGVSVHLIYWIAKFTNVEPGYYQNDHDEKWEFDKRSMVNIKEFKSILR